MKILHCADIHLDTVFSRLTPEMALTRRNEMKATFSAMMQYIRIEKTEIALFAGDILDSCHVSDEMAKFLAKEFALCPACQFYIAPGNHDYYDLYSTWASTAFPENVHIFTKNQLEVKTSPDGRAEIWGWGFTSPECKESLLAGFHAQPAKDRVILLCAHGEIDTPDSVYCPIDKKDLEDSGLDYAALGHIHNFAGVKKLGNTFYSYSGCLEGRGFDETGSKGAYDITLTKENGKAQIQVKRVRFSKKHYESDQLDVSGMEDIAAIHSAIVRLCEEKHYGEDTLLQLTLCGTVGCDMNLSTAYLEEHAPALFYFTVNDHTRPIFDLTALQSDPTIKGALYLQLKKYLDSQNQDDREIAEMALKLGLCALDGEDFF